MEEDKVKKVIDFNKVIRRLKGSKYDDGLIIYQLVDDVERLGWETATRYLDFSPSKLGRLRLLGLRKLAQIKRDDPEFFKKLVVYLPPWEADRII